MQIKISVIALAVTLLPGFALARDTTGERIDQRQTEQKQRINEGIKRGELTSREATRLRQGQERIQHMENKARSDVTITQKEARQIETAQDRESKSINQERRDRQRTSPQPSSPTARTTNPNQAQIAPVKSGVSTQPLGKAKNSDNCVLYARGKVPSLPTGLFNWQDKKNAINSNTPREGSVAMIPYIDKTGEAVGHAAVVESVTSNSITIIEGNWSSGKVTRRTATGVDLNDAANQLKIAGYYYEPK